MRVVTDRAAIVQRAQAAIKKMPSVIASWSTSHYNYLMKVAFLHISRPISLLLLLILLSACDKQSVLERIKDRGELRVVTRTGPTLYYQDRHGPAGFEYQLAKTFADKLNVSLKVIEVSGLEETYALLDNGRADIAAAGLVIDQQRLNEYRYSQSYLANQPMIVYRRGEKRPQKLADLKDHSVGVLAGGYYQNLAAQLSKSNGLSADVLYDLETADLLERVSDSSLDYAIVAKHVYTAYRGSFSKLSTNLRASPLLQQGWAISRLRQGSSALYSEIDNFFLEIKEDGLLSQWHERFFGHANEINYVSALEFSHNIQHRLPKYEVHIKRSASTLGLEWELLAAISYQESLWNPNAVSPTGVRGMMMLTHNAAKEVNISDRRDIDQSLLGGARYYLHVYKQIPEQIIEPDRTWFTLAAYNVGYGHLEDARVITQREGGDPNKWIDVKRYLPLLRIKSWYSRTKYGFARGNEPVLYVRNIRHYYDVLKLRERTRYRKKPPIRMQRQQPPLFAITPAAL